MFKRNTTNSIIALISSGYLSDIMKQGCLDLLEKCLQNDNSIHQDELNYINSEIKRHGCVIKKYDQKEALSFLQAHKKKSSTHTDYNQKKTNNSDRIKKKYSTTANSKAELNNSDQIIADLRVKGKKAVTSRDKWKRKAHEAEMKIKKLENIILESQPTGTNSKFKMVKNKFSQMYHPDKINGDRFEKMIKQEIFKEFWQEIKIIEDN
jgi:hypothetical protein